jgi:molecular chaperone DnaJ
MSLYETLDVTRDANPDEIKKAYKKMALKYHPDKNTQDPNAEDNFKKVTEAYAILSDESKRQHYDQFGSVDPSGMPDMTDINDILKNVFGGGGGGGGNPFGEMGGAFSFMFGGGGGGGGGHHGPKQLDVLNCDVTLDEVYSGTLKKIEYDVNLQCQTCNGQGAVDPNDVIKCIKCNGRGHIMQRMGPFMAQSSCPACFGNCTTIKNGRACSNCGGSKNASYKRSLKLDVPKGIPDRFQYKVEGKGNFNRAANCCNDIVIVFHYATKEASVTGTTIKHIDENSNVKVEMELKLEDLMCGFTKPIDFYGTPINVTSTGYFNPSKPIVLKGKGLPVYKKERYGDMTLSFNLVYADDERIGKYHDVYLKIFKRNKVVKGGCDNECII